MKNALRSFLYKQLLRHKAFYVILITLITLLLILTQKTWFLDGWIKYCNTAKLSLGSFSSVFEICAGFNLAYSVIKFKGDVSSRMYNWAAISLKNARYQADSVILAVKPDSEHNDELAEYIQDIETRILKDDKDNNGNVKNQGIDSFIYFGFYSIVCLVISGLEQGTDELEAAILFKLEIYSFLLVFSIVSVIYIELAYLVSNKSHFEITILAFFVILYGCSSYARTLEYTSVKAYVSSCSWYEVLFYKTGDFKTAVNYCILVCIFINLYPYFLIFRSLYFVCLQYTCTSYQIITVVRTKNVWESISDIIGNAFEKAGDKLKIAGAKMKRNSGN